jgi:hypothetical protein
MTNMRCEKDAIFFGYPILNCTAHNIPSNPNAPGSMGGRVPFKTLKLMSRYSNLLSAKSEEGMELVKRLSDR